MSLLFYKSIKFFIDLILIVFVSTTYSSASIIDYYKIQHAGEIGYLAIGVGNDFTKRYSLEFFYGHVPKYIGGIDINTFSIKNNLNMVKFNFLSLFIEVYTGVNLYYVFGSHYMISSDTRYPPEYYGIGSSRASVYTGIDFSLNSLKEHKIYLESGVNDIVLINYYNNNDIINPYDYFSLAIGYTHYF